MNIRETRDLGWTDGDALRRDPDLEPLRKLEAFDRLLAGRGLAGGR